MRRTSVLMLAVALVAATSVTTWVVAGAATKGKISGCIDDETGEIDQMRLGQTPQGGACDEGETAITWNVKGRRGSPGPQGEEGPPGPPGPTAPVYQVSETSSVVPSSSWGAVFATCDPGDLAFGGRWRALSWSNLLFWATAEGIENVGSTGLRRYAVVVYNGTASSLGPLEATVACFDNPPLRP